MTPARVLEMIAAKGQAVTLTISEAGEYDLDTNAVTLTETTVATRGVILPLSRGLKAMAGTSIQSDDQQLLLAGTIDQPPLGTKVTAGAKTFKIVEVAPLAPAGEALVYDCIIRGVP